MIENCIFEKCISNGHHGGAIYIDYNSSHPKIIGCKFYYNQAIGWSDATGGGISCWTSSHMTISGCTFKGNRATFGGGGVGFYEASEATLAKCTFDSDSASVSGGRGGAVELSSSPTVAITNCTFDKCVADSGSAIHGKDTSVADIDNSIITNGYVGQAVECANAADASVYCSDVWNNAGGDWVGCIAADSTGSDNLNEDPLYCGPTTVVQFGLHANSPCAAAQSPCGELMGAWAVSCGSGFTGPSFDISAQTGPNPFRRSVQIGYRIPSRAGSIHVLLSIYDVAGRLVRTLVDANQSGGTHAAVWDGRDATGQRARAGIYFYRVAVGGETLTERVVLIN